MLCYKAWLETRLRFVFMLVMLAVFWLPRGMGAPAQRSWMGLALLATLLNCFAALFLAGAGVNSQTTYGAASGFHGSMFFTLSLPVTRRRLFLVRAGVGALETFAYVVVTTALTLFFRPEATSLTLALSYGARVIVCTLAVYALSAFLACFLDEMWQFTGACLILCGLWLLQSHFAPVFHLSPLRAMSLWSCPLTAATPWAALLTSAALIAILLFSSLFLLERKEY